MILGIVFYVAFCMFHDGSELQTIGSIAADGSPCLLAAPVAHCPDPNGSCEARERRFGAYRATPPCAMTGLERGPRTVVHLDESPH
jgi:hypothetical protein